LPNGKEADQFREQGVAQFAQMVEIAERERGTHLKEVFVAHQRCYPWAVERTAEGNREAVKCYLDNVNSGKASYLTYYNLAALYSRMGEFDRAITNFGVYLKEGGLKYDKRSQVESDKDFKEYLLNGASDKQKTQFRILLEKMRA
jgi:lipopolysaccharide biosynthesis regulator YciM